MGKGWRYEIKGENVMTIPNFLSLYRLSFTSIVTVSDCSLKSPFHFAATLNSTTQSQTETQLVRHNCTANSP
jgi:hypothetical protein